jgi:hypothetical protein
MSFANSVALRSLIYTITLLHFLPLDYSRTATAVLYRFEPDLTGTELKVFAAHPQPVSSSCSVRVCNMTRELTQPPHMPRPAGAQACQCASLTHPYYSEPFTTRFGLTPACALSGIAKPAHQALLCIRFALPLARALIVQTVILALALALAADVSICSVSHATALKSPQLPLPSVKTLQQPRQRPSP